MRITLSNRGESGSVLMVSLLVALLIGLVLSSYLLLVRAQNQASLRSQAWNAALTGAEAGIEEAFAKLNNSLLTTNIGLENGWHLQDGLYQLDEKRVLATHPFEVSYAVAYNAQSPLTIYATGYATIPAISVTLTRTIKVETQIAPLFSSGAGTRGGIAMNGKALSSDSFDSASFVDPNRARGHGDLAFTDSITNCTKVDVHGRLFLGPSTTNRFQEFTPYAFNIDYPSVPTNMPSGQFIPPVPGTNNQKFYTCCLRGQIGQKYQVNGLTGSVYVARSAVLYITSDANITSLDIANDANLTLYVSRNASLTDLDIASRGSLTMYVAGGSTTFGTLNNSGAPKNFQYYGLPSNTNISLIGFDTNIGTIYAPDAVFRAGNKFANDTSAYLDVDLIGALVVKSINMTSDLRVHYDESLENVPDYGQNFSGQGSPPPSTGFKVKTWKEL